jgi:FAD/FMN-containing dehydrogenase
MNIVEKLKNLSVEDIAIGSDTLEEYSRSTSFFKLNPKAVIFPKNTEDIKKIVKFVSKAKNSGDDISITARAGGTGMSGGSLTESIVVDVSKYMNTIGEFGKNYGVIETGVMYRDFEKESLKHNLIFPSYPASRDICAIGGIVANNAGGEKSLKYGKTEEYVKEIRMVLADGNEYLFKSISLDELEEKKALNTFEGEVYKKMYKLIYDNYDVLRKAKPDVTKNSAGYYLWNVLDRRNKTFDLTKLIVGSQGTLGIITEVKLKLVKPEKYSRLLVIFLKDTKILAYIIRRILKYKPESFESYDDHTFKVAIKLFPKLARKISGNMFLTMFEFFPEFLMVLTGGVPKLIMIAEFTGNSEEETIKKAEMAQDGIKEFKLKTKITRTERESKKYWTFRRESFNLLRNKMKNLHTAPFIDDIIVKPSQLPEFLPRLNGLLDKYNIIYTIAGHMGDANFHIIPLMNFSDPKSIKIIERLGKQVYNLVIEFEGSITAEHNDGIIRTPFLEMMYGNKVYNLFKDTKNIFDPKNIFNPGKKIGGTMKYAIDHIDIE